MTKKRNGVTKSCVVCGRLFYVPKSRKHEAKCCSKECAAEITWKRDGWAGVQKGSHLSEEHKRKIGRANSGSRNGMYGKHLKLSEETKRKLSEAMKGRESPMKGHHHSKATKEKIRLGNLGEKRSKKTRKRISKGKKGVRLSQEHKRKISEALGRSDWIPDISVYERKLFLNGRRRAIKRKADGSHTQEEWEQLKEFYDNRCICCGRDKSEVTLTEDHIVPLSKCGSDDISNIQPLCRSCNSRKNINKTDYRNVCLI